MIIDFRGDLLHFYPVTLISRSSHRLEGGVSCFSGQPFSVINHKSPTSKSLLEAWWPQLCGEILPSFWIRNIKSLSMASLIDGFTFFPCCWNMTLLCKWLHVGVFSWQKKKKKSQEMQTTGAEMLTSAVPNIVVIPVAVFAWVTLHRGLLTIVWFCDHITFAQCFKGSWNNQVACFPSGSQAMAKQNSGFWFSLFFFLFYS